MNENLQVFQHEQFGSIRTLNENGTVLFCGSDVAKALGYAKPQNAISVHCRGALKRGIGVKTGTTPTGEDIIQNIEMLFIPESDVYRLIFTSKMPSAEQFTDWVTEEVLPSIRETGGYIMGQDELDEEAFLEKALEIAHRRVREQRRRLQAQSKVIRAQSELIEEYEPKVSYYDKILSSTDTLNVSQIAADYGISAKKLNKLLAKEGVQWKNNGQWLLKEKYKNCGYTDSATYTFSHSDGSQGAKCTPGGHSKAGYSFTTF